MIIGGCAVDITCTVSANSQQHALTRSSYPGRLQRTLGGVGCNIARVAHQCGINTNLVSVIGDDTDGYWIKEALTGLDISCQQIQRTGKGNTAIYNAIHEADGQLYVAVADMNIFDQMQPSLLAEAINETRPSFVCFDGNIPVECMRAISESCAKLNIPALFEPTSVPKSLRILQDPTILTYDAVQYITPNHHELEAMTRFMNNTTSLATNSNDTSDELTMLKTIPMLWHTVAKSAIHLSSKIPNIIVKLGEQGVLCVHRTTITDVTLKYYPALKASNIVNVTGAGDSFVGALVASLVHHGSTTSMNRLINIAQHAAIATLASHHAVSDAITPQLLNIG